MKNQNLTALESYLKLTINQSHQSGPVGSVERYLALFDWSPLSHIRDDLF